MQKMRIERKVWVGILSVTVALNGAPAFADDGSGGLFSKVFSGVSGFVSGLAQSIKTPFPSNSQAETQSPAPVEERSLSDHPKAESVGNPAPVEEIPVSSPAQTRDISRARVVSEEIVSSGPLVTHDSSYRIPGTIPKGMRWIMVNVKKKGGVEHAPYIRVAEGAPMPTVYFPDGPGYYTIRVYGSDGIKITDKSLSFLNESKVRNDDSSDREYLLPSLSVQSDAPEIIELANQITQGLVTDREKTLAIHNWVANNITYNYDGLKDGAYAANSLDALTTLQATSSVCEGYSNLTAALMRAAGLRTRVIRGKYYNELENRPANLSTAEICEKPNHAWNEVYVDNRWISVDVTADSGYSSDRTSAGFRTFDGERRFKYFDPKASAFEEDHIKCQDTGW